MISYNASQIQYLAAAGVLIDILGALLLSRALMWAKPKEIANQPRMLWTGNPYVLRSLCEQTIDARWGGMFLVVGFLLQIASNLGLQSTSDTGAAVTLASLVTGMAYLYTRTHMVRAMYEKACDASGENGEALKRLFNGTPVSPPSSPSVPAAGGAK